MDLEIEASSLQRRLEIYYAIFLRQFIQIWMSGENLKFLILNSFHKMAEKRSHIKFLGIVAQEGLQSSNSVIKKIFQFTYYDKVTYLYYTKASSFKMSSIFIILTNYKIFQIKNIYTIL